MALLIIWNGARKLSYCEEASLTFSVERTRFTNAMIRQSCLLKITLVRFSARITHFGPTNIGLIFWSISNTLRSTSFILNCGLILKDLPRYYSADSLFKS